MNYRSFLIASVAVSLTAPAMAQSIAVEEITVTARKRSESLLDVPLSITALTAADIENSGYITISDIVQAVPGMTYGSFEAEGRGDSPSIRGISVNTGDPTLQGASTFIDGVYYSGSLFSSLLANIDRVEVIKGPQSALFGRATFAGAINYITKKPTDEFEGQFNATVAEYGEIQLSGTLAGPIVEDKVGIRVTGGLLSKGSEYNNITNGEEMGDDDIFSLSTALTFTPTENLDATLSLMYTDAEFGEATRATTALNNGKLAFPDVAVIGGNVDQLDEPGLDSEAFQGSLTINYDINGYTLTSVSSYSDEDTVNQSDGNYSPATVPFLSFLCNAGPFVGPGCSIFQTVTEREIETVFQEIRIASPEDENVNWLLGASYFEEKFSTARLRNFRQPPTEKTSNNLSIFGSVGMDLSDTVAVTVDARYQTEDIENLNLDTNGLQEDEFNSFLPRVIFEYTPNDDTLLYASASKGNKPGNFNTTAPPQFLTVDEESLWNYEIGTKLSTLDGALSIQWAGFFIDWSNQAFRFNDPDPTVGSYFINSGKTDVLGTEISLAARLDNGLSGSFSYSYVDAEYQVFESQNARTILGDPDVSGNKTPRTAKHSAFASLSYQAPLTMVSADMDWFARADLSYRSKIFIDELNLEYLGSQTLLNLRLGIDNGPVRFTVFADNVNNSQALTTGFRFGAVALVGLPQGRQFGASLAYKF